MRRPAPRAATVSAPDMSAAGHRSTGTSCSGRAATRSGREARVVGFHGSSRSEARRRRVLELRMASAARPGVVCDGTRSGRQSGPGQAGRGARRRARSDGLGRCSALRRARSSRTGAAPGGASEQRCASSGASSSVAPAPKDGRPPPKDSSPAPKDSITPARETSPVPKDPSAAAPGCNGPELLDGDASATAEIAGEPAAAEIFEPEKPVVVVSEAAPSAAITIRRRGSLDGSTSFVWWTTDGTAIADEDYINLGARIEKLAAGEQARTISRSNRSRLEARGLERASM